MKRRAAVTLVGTLGLVALSNAAFTFGAEGGEGGPQAGIQAGQFALTLPGLRIGAGEGGEGGAQLRIQAGQFRLNLPGLQIRAREGGEGGEGGGHGGRGGHGGGPTLLRWTSP